MRVKKKKKTYQQKIKKSKQKKHPGSFKNSKTKKIIKLF